MPWDTLALLFPSLMLGWLVLTEWVPLYPLNDLAASTPRERAQLAVVNYGTLIAMMVGIASGTQLGAIAAAGLAGLWVIGHIASWWLPYLGVSTADQRDAYQREYARTLKVLPTDGHAVVPDVQHMVVGLILVPMVTSIWMAALGAF